MLVVLAWTAVGGLVPPVKSSSAPPASSPSGSGATSSATAGDGDDRNENPLVAGSLLSTAGAVTAGVSSAASVDADGIMKLKPEVAAVGADVSPLAVSSVAPGAADGGAESSCMNENPLAPPPPPTPPVSVAAGAGAVPSVASVDGAVLFRKENDETAAPGAAGAASWMASATGPALLLLLLVVAAAVLFMNPNALPATGAGAGAEGSPPSWLVPLTLPPPPVALSLISRPPNIAVNKISWENGVKRLVDCSPRKQ
mmetsp:Transcript_11500/g.27494  ORF Transcript_11500/g.27494 Transcript_11500/m.27494 type:complete len:256 (+) Transcript_11500:3324-4091(+)